MNTKSVFTCVSCRAGRAVLIGCLIVAVHLRAEPAAGTRPLAVENDMLAKCIKILTYGAVHDYFKPTKRDAVVALGILGDERAVPTLIAHLENEDNAELRKEIVRALGLIGSQKAVPALETALKDTYPHTRRHAAYALKQITGKDYDYDNTGLPDPSKLRELLKSPGRENEEKRKG